ncbi:MAG: YcxB family protein [Planctomycetes bacterium]|nr:YcxB family protein [Planctomycetota bacterium]
MKVVVKGQYEFQDYLAAHRLNRRGARMAFSVAEVVWGAVLVSYASIFPNSLSALEGAAGMLMIAWGLYFNQTLFTFRVRRRWAHYPALRETPLDLTFGDEGVFGTDDAGNPGLMSWQRFIRWKEDEAVFLLYLSPHLWLAIPKRLMEPAEAEKLRALFRTRVGGATQGRHILAGESA